jgi:hypothetical protein
MKRHFLGLALLLQAMGASATPLPSQIAPERFGAPTFEERFKTFDYGVDQIRPAKPHRWRVVSGSGGPLSPSNRSMSGTSFAADPAFSGVRDGKAGPRPFGLNPFEVTPGQLNIVARPTPPEIRPWAWNKPYVSGQAMTKFSFSQLHGYFEIEAKLPKGKGLWPAFWLLPVTGQWPHNGELDIFEGLGDPFVIYCTVISGTQHKVQKKIALPFDSSAGFHLYGAAWGPDEIVWYVDRREVLRTPTPADMKTVPMFIRMNLAVGGAWGGHPDASTVFPARYAIRRVSAWRLPG